MEYAVVAVISVLSVITLITVFLASVALFGINYEREGKWFSIKIKSKKVK
ncbi:MAG: hypothetical protein Q7J85_03820 [Bacillota bacterium]|nr:hypothetical protein [Bacillota bacterium]